MFCAPSFTFCTSLSFSETRASAVNGGTSTMSRLFSLATSIRNESRNESASLSVMFIFQLAAIILRRMRSAILVHQKSESKAHRGERDDGDRRGPDLAAKHRSDEKDRDAGPTDRGGELDVNGLRLFRCVGHDYFLSCNAATPGRTLPSSSSSDA